MTRWEFFFRRFQRIRFSRRLQCADLCHEKVSAWAKQAKKDFIWNAGNFFSGKKIG
jgi:hypothetical protein